MIFKLYLKTKKITGGINRRKINSYIQVEFTFKL